MAFHEGEIVRQTCNYGIWHADKDQLVKVVRIHQTNPGTSKYEIAVLSPRREEQAQQGTYFVDASSLARIHD